MNDLAPAARGSRSTAARSTHRRAASGGRSTMAARAVRPARARRPGRRHPDRRAAHVVTVLEVRQGRGCPSEVLIDELQPDGGQLHPAADGADAGQTVPYPKLEAAIEALADRDRATSRRRPAAAARRGHRHPVVAHHPARCQRRWPAPPGGRCRIHHGCGAEPRRVYLAVHGPPGTGKTFTAARVIKSTGQRARLAHRRGGTVTRGRGEPARLDHRGRS